MYGAYNGPMRFRLRTLLTAGLNAVLIALIIIVAGWMLIWAARESRKSAEEGAKAYSRP
jgi:hypothetical protein